MDIKSVIKRKGFTLEQVGKAMNPPVTKGTISQTVNNNPTVETLRKIADIIGCGIAEFFEDETPDALPTLRCPHCNKSFGVQLVK